MRASDPSGILLIDKPKGKTSFSLVSALRKHLNVQKIGHAGTLDPFATGVMILLVGKEYTKRSNEFLGADKEYNAELLLGVTTDSYDCDGQVLQKTDIVPKIAEVENALKQFQGEISQIPPMFSAKKVNGKRLYKLARAGIVIEREPQKVRVNTKLVQYNYPHLHLHIECSKGTYIRSIAHDLGSLLGCGGSLNALQRVRSGPYKLEDCVDGALVLSQNIDVRPFFIHGNPH